MLHNIYFLCLQGPIVPCTHAMLAKWIPPNERSRMGAFVYAGETTAFKIDHTHRLIDSLICSFIHLFMLHPSYV